MSPEFTGVTRVIKAENVGEIGPIRIIPVPGSIQTVEAPRRMVPEVNRPLVLATAQPKVPLQTERLRASDTGIVPNFPYRYYRDVLDVEWRVKPKGIRGLLDRIQCFFTNILRLGRHSDPSYVRI